MILRLAVRRAAAPTTVRSVVLSMVAIVHGGLHVNQQQKYGEAWDLLHRKALRNGPGRNEEAYPGR